MRFHAISTFHREGLDLYGRRMVETFARFWPQDVALTIYADGWCEDLGRGGLLDLYEASPWLAAFKERHAGLPTGGDQYRKDAVRFAHKVAAVCHAARRDPAEYLIWIDGDVVTHAPVMLGDLAHFVPTCDEWISWLDRAHAYPECGFYILNCRHPRHEEMIEAFEAMYRDDLLFSLPEWHDSFVLEAVVKRAGIGTKSLSGDFRHTGHPFVNGPLGAFMDHLKGKRKTEGRSRRQDMRAARTEAYWR